MSTRKIKNAKDLESNELIYFKSHAQATFMSDGSTVEDVINEIKENGGADLTDYVTTTQLNTSLSGKQDTISDLDDIRSGASKGATAVQPSSVATAVTINGVDKTISSNKINIGTIPTAVTIDNVSKTPSSGVVNLGYVNKQVYRSSSSSMTLTPNTYHINTNTSLTTLTISLGSVSNSNIMNEYFVEFTTHSSGPTVFFPNTIKWSNGTNPTFEAGYTYQVSIVNNLGTWVKFK